MSKNFSTEYQNICTLHFALINLERKTYFQKSLNISTVTCFTDKDFFACGCNAVENFNKIFRNQKPNLQLFSARTRIYFPSAVFVSTEL